MLESRWKRLTAPGEEPSTRLRVVRLPARAPIAPATVVPAAATPEPLGAVRYVDWIVPDTAGVTVLHGRAAGTATITNRLPSVARGEVAVEYDRYSDDGAHFLDGFERIRIPDLLLAGAEYEVYLRLRGREKGSMKGAIAYDFAGDVNAGEVAGRLGRRRLRGPSTCEAAGVLP